MSAEEPLKPRPSDASLWSDRDLRPWTIDDELDKKIADENERLDDCVQKTSGSKIAGVRGLSQLDAKPQQFLDFERFISDPGWLYKLGSAEMDAEEEKQFQEMVAAAQAAISAEQESQNPETNMALINPDDKLLLNSILEFNQALYDRSGSRGGPRGGNAAAGTRESQLRAKAEAFQQFIDMRGITTKKSRSKKKKTANPAYQLSGIRYERRRNPAVMNVSTVEFQKLLERFNMTMPVSQTLGKSRSAPAFLKTGLDSRDDPGVVEGSLSSSLQRADQSTVTNRKANDGNVLTLDTAQRAKDMDALAQFLAQTKSSPDTKAVQATSLSPVPESKELEEIFNLRENDLLRPATSSISPSRPSSSSGIAMRPSSSSIRPTSTSLLLRGTEFSAEERALLEANIARGGATNASPPEIPTSPIQRMSARPGSRLDRGGRSDLTDITDGPSLGHKSTLLDPLPSPSSPPKSLPLPLATTRLPSTSRPPTGLKSVSESRTSARLSTPSQALNKLSISASTGTIHGSPGSFGKARIQAMRTLRDQLMSTSGSLAMNVHPEASPDAQSDAKESVRVTKEMVKETIEKNRVDQTWTLLATPGYYEAVGPDQIFKSDTQLGFLVNDRFDEAVKNADVSQGIKRDPLRVWSEDGVKNKIKIFQSGGAMKM